MRHHADSEAAPPNLARWTDLAWTLVRTDFKTRYHGTIGGFCWALLKPMSMFVVLMSVFSFVFSSDPAYKSNLIVGLCLFDFFAEGTKVGMLSLATKAYLLTRVRLPLSILVLTSSANPLLSLAVLSVLLLGFQTAIGHAPTFLGVLLFFLYAGLLLLMVIGISLGSSVLFLRYRDLNQVWEVVIQAGFFVAPVIYPLSIIPERFHFYLYAWPPTAIIEFGRAVLIGHQVPSFRAHLMLLLMTAAILAGGVLLFRRLAPRAAEYV